MDLKYKEAADYYGFDCTGCEDNCCFTRFFHHTLLEYLYIMEGYGTTLSIQKGKYRPHIILIYKNLRFYFMFLFKNSRTN